MDVRGASVQATRSINASTENFRTGNERELHQQRKVHVQAPQKDPLCHVGEEESQPVIESADENVHVENAEYLGS